jgi:hypothetical protein
MNSILDENTADSGAKPAIRAFIPINLRCGIDGFLSNGACGTIIKGRTGVILWAKVFFYVDHISSID